ncbi:hypothetical protein CcaverHIS002_0310640 [Cutaneotrichosporon cavernicola]|uniref:Nuclear segregation protein Bfr1 n=1 Tax=Cutaneotrichosporon cavernicola TaxID=279322 RepID=A0AA48L2Y2_9TREE|nr:uncharacterized protein CcaverHIS019_0310500 [Cutaneotrichosporon cavernicola]BEI83196.1 hypothetical protein CcaverHIS002_0310640 [Cutaneotrichosporon cavernicola]BEI90980.1 hypothetical protein CcaverHIS019_0310500 [Cutaneotrichosporon cavernicola]BEI98758.1 hypothetical protein CcaverHIS631_0310570 [Cutaneotrichosporon cavernicola]BEJ06530.1 hypothetical protein CcaverHIS641_0310520 [Cutaneotrichosporon cavernicola]
MPPPTASQKPAKLNGKSEAPAKPAAAEHDEHSGKPDQAKYNAEQDALNKEIAALKVKQDAIRNRIALTQAPKGDDRRSQLKAEMDKLRGEQGKFKTERGKLFDEMRKLQDNVNKKIKDVQAQRQKTGFKNVAEVDARVAALNAQVEAGTLKLVDEKKALQEITILKRARRTMEASGTSDEAIAADKARIDALKAQLDDPEAKKVSEQFDVLKKEMDLLRAEGDKAYAERNKLFDERNAISKSMDELYDRKREAAQSFHDAKDKYYAKQQAIRQARQERFKAEKAKEDAARRDEEINQMREDARAPAYAAEIEDATILISYFTGKYGGEVPVTSTEKKEKTIAGVKAVEVRQVTADFAGMQLKKKDDELDGWFAGSAKKKKGRKGGNSNATSGAATPAPAQAHSDSVNVPMNLLSALLAFGISPPAGKDDITRAVADLETKKAWFEANSEQKTKDEIARVDKLVAKMQKKNAPADDDEAEPAEEKDESAAEPEPVVEDKAEA